MKHGYDQSFYIYQFIALYVIIIPKVQSATTKSATIDILALNNFCATPSFYRVINSNLMNVMIIRRYLEMKTCLTCNTLSADMSCLKINA